MGLFVWRGRPTLKTDNGVVFCISCVAHSPASTFIELHFASWCNTEASQRSLHNAPIFRLLLKVAVNGTHQCDFLNFCGGFGSQQSVAPSLSLVAPSLTRFYALSSHGTSTHHTLKWVCKLRAPSFELSCQLRAPSSKLQAASSDVTLAQGPC